MSTKSYTVTIYYAHAGSPTSGGASGDGKSGPGHMWYSIGDGAGPEKSYGFGPKKGSPVWPGKVTTDDNSTYLEKHGKTREITRAQYEALEKFGEDPSSAGFSTGWYNAFTHSCVDFTWKAMYVAGLNPFDFEGYPSPQENIGNIERIGDPNDPPRNFVSRWFNELWNQAKSWFLPRRDPLALDLDGDGIETRGADGRVVFDHNGDGVKTGTGWLRPDDGWLVLDRNSNGTIDNGGELFGVDTVKADGTKATDGFDALSDLDSNDDGVFDAKDTRFADVRIWRDRNQDGISQSSELSTLAANNIRSISLSKTTATTNLGNGNAQTATATFTRTDDTTGTAANLGLAINTFYRRFTNRITLTDTAKKLPEVNGSGRVRNLREAMSGSSSLTTLVDTYAKQTTYTSQRAQLDGLVRAWAGTSDQNTSIQAATDKGFELIYMIPGQTRAHFARRTITSTNNTNNSTTTTTPLTTEETRRRRALMAEQAKIKKMIAVLEAFNGNHFVTVNDNSVTTGSGTEVSAITDTSTNTNNNNNNNNNNLTNTTNTGNGNMSLGRATRRAFVSLSQQQVNLLKRSYEQLKEAVYVSLLRQTRLKDYSDKLSVTVNTQGQLALDFTAMNTLLTTRRSKKAVETLGDLIELARYLGPGLAANGWEGFATLKTWVSEANGKAAEEKLLTDLGVKSGNANASGTGKAEIFYDGSNGSTINAGGGNDIVFGGGGNDTLNGGSGDDMLHGEGLAMLPLWALRRKLESPVVIYGQEVLYAARGHAYRM